MLIENGKEIQIKCNSSGKFPTPTWPNCTKVTVSNDRKKRSADYSHIQSDMDYTVLVLFETQFMWNDGIEREVNETTNKTREDRKEFPTKMIEHFHDTLETALGPVDKTDNTITVNTLRIKSQNIRPLCEQTMIYNYEIISASTGQPETEIPIGISDCVPTGGK